MLELTELTDKQKFFLWTAGYFASLVLAENELFAHKTLNVLRASAHLMGDDEWTELGQYLAVNMENYAKDIMRNDDDDDDTI